MDQNQQSGMYVCEPLNQIIRIKSWSFLLQTVADMSSASTLSWRRARRSWTRRRRRRPPSWPERRRPWWPWTRRRGPSPRPCWGWGRSPAAAPPCTARRRWRRRGPSPPSPPPPWRSSSPTAAPRARTARAAAARRWLRRLPAATAGATVVPKPTDAIASFCVPTWCVCACEAWAWACARSLLFFVVRFELSWVLRGSGGLRRPQTAYPHD